MRFPSVEVVQAARGRRRVRGSQTSKVAQEVHLGVVRRIREVALLVAAVLEVVDDATDNGGADREDRGEGAERQGTTLIRISTSNKLFHKFPALAIITAGRLSTGAKSLNIMKLTLRIGCGRH